MGGGSWAWPDVDTLEDAADAAHKAAYFAWVAAGFTAIYVLVVSASGAFPAVAIGITLAIAVAYALIGWQVYTFSRAFAFLGLTLYALDLGLGIYYLGPSLYGGIRFVFLIGFINGVRGTFAYERLSRETMSGSRAQQA